VQCGWSWTISTNTSRSGGAIASVASKIGCATQTLCDWVRQAERDMGQRNGPSTGEKQRVRELERELRRANEILRQASAFFRAGGARPPTQVMVTFIDEHPAQYGVEPICKEVPIAPSVY